MLKNVTAPPSDVDDAVPSPAGMPASLVSLLGEQRARLVEHLHRGGPSRLAELAAALGVSEVATRRHLGVLVDEDLVAVSEVANGPGRPAKHYSLTDRARRLFPERYAALASDLLEFLADSHGRQGVRDYLTWRLERETRDLADQVTADELPDRLRQLAAALSDAGYDASVDEVGDRFVLRQEHCAIYDVANEHPEMCAYEAATFSKVLGRDVRLSRRVTRTNGGDACECCVSPRDADAPPPERRLPVLVDGRPQVALD